MLFLDAVKFPLQPFGTPSKVSKSNFSKNQANKMRNNCVNHMEKNVHNPSIEREMFGMTNRLFRTNHRTSVKETRRNWIRAAWTMTWNNGNGTHLEFFSTSFFAAAAAIATTAAIPLDAEWKYSLFLFLNQIRSSINDFEKKNEMKWIFTLLVRYIAFREKRREK